MEYFNTSMVKKTIVIGLLVILIATGAGLVDANGEDLTDETGVSFPAWTYYAEIAEHSLIIIASAIAMLFLVRPYRARRKEERQGILMMMTGLAILLISQLLTNLHHFSVFLFGIWNAIIHHGLLSASVVIMITAFFKEKKLGKRR